MDSILIILKKKNGPRASSAPILGLLSVTFVYTADLTEVSVYRTIGSLVASELAFLSILSAQRSSSSLVIKYWTLKYPPYASLTDGLS